MIKNCPKCGHNFESNSNEKQIKCESCGNLFENEQVDITLEKEQLAKDDKQSAMRETADSFTLTDDVNSKVKERNKNIAYLGISFALIIVLAYLPAIATVKLALPLIIIIITSQLKGVKMGAITGLFYGLVSFFDAWVTSPSVLRFAFQNPLVSIVPRLLVGVFTALIYGAIRKACKKLDGAKRENIASYISALLAVVLNTFMVLGTILVLFNGKMFTSGESQMVVTFKSIISMVFAFNSILEWVVLPIVCSPLVIALRKSQRLS